MTPVGRRPTMTASIVQRTTPGRALDELVALARRYAATPERWLVRPRSTAHRRWYHRLAADDDHEAWLLTWLPGLAAIRSRQPDRVPSPSCSPRRGTGCAGAPRPKRSAAGVAVRSWSTSDPPSNAAAKARSPVRSSWNATCWSGGSTRPVTPG